MCHNNGPAEVGDGPGDVAEEPDGDAGGVDEADERLDDAVVDDVVAQGGAVAGDVAQGPYGLLAHINYVIKTLNLIIS